MQVLRHHDDYARMFGVRVAVISRDLVFHGVLKTDVRDAVGVAPAPGLALLSQQLVALNFEPGWHAMTISITMLE